MGNYSVNNIDINKTYKGALISITVSGTYSLDLSQSNLYELNLSANTVLNYTDAETTTYNLMVNTGGFDFALGSGYKTVDGEFATVSGTQSFLISTIYDGTKMWVAHNENYIDK